MSQESGSRLRPGRRVCGRIRREVMRLSTQDEPDALAAVVDRRGRTDDPTPELTVRRHRDVEGARQATADHFRGIGTRAAQAARGVDQAMAEPIEPWDPADPGVLRLPSGRLVRGRGLRHPLPDGRAPTYAVYCLGKEPPEVPWASRWLRWPDFRLPADRAEAAGVLRDVWDRAAADRVELACGGGRGRTGTALACLAVLDGVPPQEAVAYVRRHYDRHAVETPWQRRYVRRFEA